MKKQIIALFLILVTGQLYCDAPAIGLPISGEKIFEGLVENRQKQLEKVEKDKEQFLKEKNESEAELKSLSEELKAQIDKSAKELEKDKDSDFLKQKQLLLNDFYQIVRDIIRSRERTVAVLDDLIRELKEFLDDPDFAALKKEQRLSERLFYSFDDIQRLYNLILDQEKKVGLFTDQEKHALAELDNQKRAQSATKETYGVKKEQIESGKYLHDIALDAQQKSELISLEERIFAHHKRLDALRIKETEYKIELASLQLSIAKSHLSIYRDYLRAIKPAVRVTDADIVQAKEQLAKATTTYRVTKEKFRSEIDKQLIRQEHTQKELQESAKSYGISLGHEVTNWARTDFQTPQAYLEYCEVAMLQSQLTTYQRREELIEAQISLEDEKMKDQALQLQVKESYHKKFTTEEEIASELKKYEGPRSESRAGLSRFKERITTVADNLNTQKKILDNIVALRAQLEKMRDTIFKSSAAEYHRCSELLRRAEAFEKEQIDILSKLTGVYSGLTQIENNKIRLINFIVSELESRTIWYRPEYAITLEGIKNIVPDTINFLMFVRNYFARGSLVGPLNRVIDLVKDPMSLLILLIKLLTLIIILIGVYRLLPRLINGLIRSASRGFARMVGMLLAGMCTYLYRHFFAISLWIVVFSVLLFQDIVDTYLYIIFYLISIPYLLYLANRFVSTLAQFNQENEYPYIAADFQRRFWLVLSVLLYSTITIVFFREAFMLAHYYRSELPTILLAVNFIIFQIALILLIDKEQILGFIPSKNDVWLWIREQVDRFYYVMLLLLIAVIIMSNPYVGFGRLVLYALFGVLYSFALLLVLYWLHGIFKRLSSRLFFVSVDDVARERFTGAKTWFGITIIFSFLILSFIGLVVAAKIWGWPITLSKVTELFNYPLIGMDTKNPITMVTFFKILSFVFIGFIIAYGLNRFVLDRIFDLLLVDPGVQHTVSSISQYLVVITAAFLGFQNANLGALVNYIVGALILGLGWVLKDPISDFVAYFIILVQRPIKIGDFIRIDDEITGVVRKITARAVILRRKNSITLVVPNSIMISRTIVNWNYTRNFIAFDDIHVTVDYGEDPDRVRQILYSVVESYPNILKNPKPWVRLDHFGEFGYEFMVRGFISSVYTLEKWEIASNIRINIVKKFDEENIKIALPTRLLLTRMNRMGEMVSNRENPK